MSRLFAYNSAVQRPLLGRGRVRRGIGEFSTTRGQVSERFPFARVTSPILLLRVVVPDSMADLDTNEIYRVTAAVPSTPVRETFRPLNTPVVNDEMDIDEEIRQVVHVNTIADKDRFCIGAEAFQAASTALFADLRAQLDRSSFIAVDASFAQVIADFETLRKTYSALLASVRQKGVRIEQRDTALRTYRQDLATAEDDLERNETVLRASRRELATAQARVTELENRSSNDAAVTQFRTAL